MDEQDQIEQNLAPSNLKILSAIKFLALIIVFLIVSAVSYWWGRQSPISTINAPPVTSIPDVSLDPTQQQLVNEEIRAMRMIGSGWHQINFGNFDLSLPPDFYLTNPRPKDEGGGYGYAYVFLNFNNLEEIPHNTDMAGKYKLDIVADPGMCIFSQVKERVKNSTFDLHGIELDDSVFEDIILPQGYQAIKENLNNAENAGSSSPYYVQIPNSDNCVGFGFYLDFITNEKLANEILSTLRFP